MTTPTTVASTLKFRRSTPPKKPTRTAGGLLGSRRPSNAGPSGSGGERGDGEDLLQRLMKHADNLGRATPETRSRSSALDLRSLRHRGSRDQWVLVRDLLRQEQRPTEGALLPSRACRDLPVGGRGSDPGCRSVHGPPPSHPPRVDPASPGSGPLVSGRNPSATDEKTEEEHYQENHSSE
jgi:hypothetical protein